MIKPSKTLLKKCVTMCKAVYHNPLIEKNCLSASITTDKGTQYIAFTGSENLPNWFSNLYVLKVKRSWYKGKAHKGFVNCLEGLRGTIMERVTKDPIVVTGHSLGGAMAVLMARYLMHLGYNVKEVITFGKPRVGNKEFKEDYESFKVPTCRVVNGQDVVPTVPKIGFKHEGWSLVIDDGRVSSYSVARETKDFIMSPFDFTREHKIDDYIASINKLTRKA